MADSLVKVIASDRDKANCPFYFKIGACKYMDKCQRRHIFPKISPTLLIPHLFSNNPIDSALANHSAVNQSDMERATNRYQQFYQDIFKEVSRFGLVQDLVVCANLSPHLVGNVYVRFYAQQDSQKCYNKIKGRYYSDILVQPQYSPVHDFQVAKCKQQLQGTCKRGGNCNFMHVKHISGSFKKIMFQQMYQQHPQYLKRKKMNFKHNRDRSRKRSRSRSGSDDSAKRRAKIDKWNKQN